MSFAHGFRASLLILLASAMPAYAQQTGEVSGKVVDSSGAVLPGVTVCNPERTKVSV